MPRLAGKVAFITGAGRGIGCAIAERFAAEGASVSIAELDTGRAQPALEAIAGEGGTAFAVACAASQPETALRNLLVSLKLLNSPHHHESGNRLDYSHLRRGVCVHLSRFRRESVRSVTKVTMLTDICTKTARSRATIRLLPVA